MINDQYSVANLMQVEIGRVTVRISIDRCFFVRNTVKLVALGLVFGVFWAKISFDIPTLSFGRMGKNFNKFCSRGPEIDRSTQYLQKIVPVEIPSKSRFFLIKDRSSE